MFTYDSGMLQFFTYTILSFYFVVESLSEKIVMESKVICTLLQ